MEVLNGLRSCFKSRDEWKISFRDLQEEMYSGLSNSLLGIKKDDEALFAAEQLRVQTLSDNSLSQFILPASLPATVMA